MRCLAIAATALALLAGAGGARAEAWPTHPIRVIVPFPPGSTPDLTARLVTQGWSETLGQPIVIDNRSGAGGNIGTDLGAKAKPDGYTLVIGSNGPIAINQALYTSMPYDAARDLTPISLLVRAPQIFVVIPSLPVQSLADLIAYAKSHPGALSFGSVGAGSASHLTMEALKFTAGIDLVHVPYRGFPAVVTDLLAGQIQATCAIAASVLPQIKDGKLRGLAITTAQHSSIAPDLPSVGELGYPALESYAWIGLLVPAGTPPVLIARLHDETIAALKKPAVHDTLIAQGYEVIGDTPEQYAAYIRAETARWTAVIKRTGVKLDQ